MVRTMKLRQAPQDFRVEEVSDIKATQTELGFGLYLLEKRGLDTFTLLAYLSKRLGVPYKDFGIAGLKDRHAITKQFVTIPSVHKVGSLEEENFRLEHLGYVAKPIELGDLVANRFEITVRDLRKADLQGIEERTRDAQAFGFPNYFDSQRFGSVIHGEFIARHILKGDLERAVKIFLTGYTRAEKAKVKDDKRAILENWDDLGDIRPATGILARVVDEYRATKDWGKAFLAIPRNLRELYMSAFQSYLWNECIMAILTSKVRRERLFTVHYNLGELVFFKRLDEKELKDIPRTFKTVSHKVEPSVYEGQVIDAILKKEGLGLKDLNVKKRTGYFFKVYDRPVIVRPDGLSLKGPVSDELNDRSAKGGQAKYKITLAFTLPKGSYATVLTKRIFKR